MKSNDFAFTLSSDLFRLKKLKSVFVGLVLIFVIIFLTFALCWIGMNLISRIDVGEGTPDEDGIVVDENDMPVISQEYKDEMTALFENLTRDSLMGSGAVASIEFFVMIIVCIFVGKDFSNGTVRLMVSRGTNRAHTFFSKWVSAALLVTAYSVFALIMSGIMFSFKPTPFPVRDFGILMRCFSLEWLVNISTMSIFMMIAFLCRSSGSSLGVSIGFYVVLNIVLSVISTVLQMTGGNMDWLMFMPLQQMTVASSSATLGTTELCAVIIMPFVYIAASIGIGLATFLKRDIK